VFCTFRCDRALEGFQRPRISPRRGTCAESLFAGVRHRYHGRNRARCTSNAVAHVRYGRSHAQAGGAGQGLRRRARARVRRRSRSAQVGLWLHQHVGGGKTQLAADAVAAHHPAADAVVARPRSSCARRMSARRQRSRTAVLDYAHAMRRHAADRRAPRSRHRPSERLEIARSPPRRAPNGNPSPTRIQRAASPRRRMRSMNPPAWFSPKSKLKPADMHTLDAGLAPATPSFSRNEVSRVGAWSGAKNSRGCGSNVIARR